MSEPYSGGCACGAIRYEIRAQPIMAGHCQCRDCQRASGTGHASYVAFPEESLRLTGQPAHYGSRSASGNLVKRAFCPKCGSPVYSLNAAMFALVFVRAGSLDDPGRFRPQMVVFASRGHSWDFLDPSLPKFSEMPPGEPPTR